MANISKVGGATKFDYGGGYFEYDFPTFRAVVSGNALDLNGDGLKTVQFWQLEDPRGASNMEEYMDILAREGYFNPAQEVELNGGTRTLTGKVQTAEFETQIDLKMLYSSLPLQYGQALGGGGTATYDIAKSAVDFAVSTTGDYAIRQTRVRFNYRSGKMQVFMFTVAGMQSQSGVEKRVGAFNGGQVAPFDTYDGIFLKSDGSGYALCICNDGDEVAVPRSAWYDKLDGSGPSGAVIDFEKEQLFEFNYLWFGVGGVIAYIYVNGKKTLFAQRYFANEVAKPFMLSPNQPMRYELRSTGGAGALMQGCVTVGAFGGGTRFTKKLGVDTALGLTLSSTASWYLVYAFRLRSTRLDASTKLGSFSILPTNNNNVLFCVVLNPTFSSAPTYAPATYFDVEIAVGNGTITAADRNFVAFSDLTEQRVAKFSPDDDNNIRFGSDVDGTADVIAILARPRGTNTTIDATANIISDR